jgi:ribosomal protein L32
MHKCLRIMSQRVKKLVAMFATTAILLNLVLANMKVAHSTGTGGKIDLFTQKEPFSGKGPNMPSDAFGPQEVVILYALVTYDEAPLQNSLVTFNVKTPCNESFSLTARTNSSGIATVNFAIVQKCVNQTEAFGEWFASASVLIEGVIFQDTLTFKVGWIIQLISVKTIYENLTYGASFGIEGDVGLQIALKSIAKTMRNATLAITIQDVSKVPVNSSTILDFEVPPNERLIFVYCKLYLPKWSRPGVATVSVSALKSDGSAYCPGISADFMITVVSPLTINFHDVAVVAVIPSARSIQVGQGLSLKTIVRNQGTVAQDFNVSTYFDNVLLGTSKITALLPYFTVAFDFTVNASLLTVGNHTISASIPPVPNEADLTGNYFADVIEVTPIPPVIIHDISITYIQVSNTTVFIGEMVHISVAVLNTGTEVETFDLSTYYNSSLIETRLVSALGPASQIMLNFTWNTISVHEGSYKISAFAPLPGDPTPSDNTLVDGVVHVKAKPPPAVKWYTLTIIATAGGTTDPAPGLYNYTSGATVEVKAIPGENYTLNHWELDNVNVGSVSPYGVLMDGNHTLKAIFSAAPTRLLIPEMLLLSLLIGLAMLVGICLIFALLYVLWWRRRKRKRSTQLKMPREVGFQKTKTCGKCGKQFNGAHTFCPYCFTFHGKDYQ